jgi:hypothetical protein
VSSLTSVLPFFLPSFHRGLSSPPLPSFLHGWAVAMVAVGGDK